MQTFQYDDLTVRAASATRIGGREVNADGVAVIASPLGIGVAVIDGIGSNPETVAAARLAADVAATVGSHRNAQAALLAASDVIPDYPTGPNAVGAVATVDPGGRIEISHVGDCAVFTWSSSIGLRRWTVGETAGAHIEHMLYGNPDLPDTHQAVLRAHAADIVAVMDDYILGTISGATISTISWAVVRDEVDVVLLTSDGVHKAILPERIAELAERHNGDAEALADALVNTAVAEAGEDADNATVAVVALSPVDM